MIPDSNNSLGGIALPRGVRWINERQKTPVGQSVRVSLAGDEHIRARALQRRDINLEVRRPNSWLAVSVLSALEALAATPGGQFSLVWQGDTYTVMFRHEDPPALDFTHVDSPAVAIDYGVYEGIIKLKQV